MGLKDFYLAAIKDLHCFFFALLLLYEPDWQSSMVFLIAYERPAGCSAQLKMFGFWQSSSGTKIVPTAMRFMVFLLG